MRLQRTGVIAGLIYLVIGLAWISLTQPPLYLIAWLFAVAVAGSYIPGEANQVTLARAYLAVPALAYATSGELGLLAVVVAVAGLTDLLDGTVARRFSHPSQLGGALDPVVDGVFLGALCIGLALGGFIPLWLALVVIARYLVPAVAGGLLIVAGRKPDLRHTLTGQVSTTLILVLVGGVCLLRGLKQDAGLWLDAAEIVIPIATLATFVHLGWAASRRPAGVAEPG
ncbi:MAG TPA: CDP-alcohol phosphatidyltransferase family protein [Candidatus Dormibacteraeota bacterium]|nr:CDP-alcohol phosphatidyltransferase family protein [Candidatus Dormibacteraeota bacterium]